MNPWRISPLRLLCIALATLSTGCRTNYYNISRIINEPAPVPESVRKSFGVVGALPANVSPDFYFTAPLNKSAGAEKATVQTFDSMEKATRFKWDHHGPSGIAGDLTIEVARILFSAIISGTVGTLTGIIAGVPDEKLKQAEQVLRQALNDDPLDRGIIAKIYQTAEGRRCDKLLPVPEAMLGNFTIGSFNRSNFTALASTGIDSVLLIRIYRQHFSVAEGINPPMSYYAAADVKVVSTRDVVLLHSGYLEYHSRRHTFMDWAANDASRFRGETRRAQRIFASVILDQLFTVATNN
jgi:hypothetical protein